MAGTPFAYQYTIEMYRCRQPPEHVGTASVVPDFGPIEEWAKLQAVRRGPSCSLNLDAGEVRTEPRWDETLGAPYLEAIRATVLNNGSPPQTFEIPLTFFQGAARSASSQLVDKGALEKGELFNYLVCAYVRDGPGDVPRGDESVRFSVEAVAEPLVLGDGYIERCLAESRACGSESESEEDLPVFMPQYVLDEVWDTMRSAGPIETGGILIGHLRRDVAREELFLEVSAQVPAQHAEQELTRLTFTPETWAAVDAAIALRGRKEMQVGWWHSHPAGEWCNACPPDVQAQCKASGKSSGDFFSAHDVALHRTVFPRAYNVALLITESCHAPARGPVWRLFGWRYGMVAARGFRVLDVGKTSTVAGPGR